LAYLSKQPNRLWKHLFNQLKKYPLKLLKKRLRKYLQSLRLRSQSSRPD
jgi:hypothetical protein